MSAYNDLEKWMPILYKIYRKELLGSQTQTKKYASPVEIDELANSLRILQTGFTGHRRQTGKKYLDEPKLLGAYLLYYWPISYLQARTVFDELAKRGFKPQNIIDCGSGPAPLACAAIDSFKLNSVSLLDHSQKALDIAQALILEVNDKIRIKTYAETIESHQLKDNFDLIAFGHSINELNAKGLHSTEKVKIVTKYSQKLNPRANLVIIEPALKEQNEGLLYLRDQVVSQQFHVSYPCFFKGPCPALAESSSCHSSYRGELPKTVLQLAQKANLKKDVVSMSALAFSKEPSITQAFRVISEPMLNKSGRTRVSTCGIEGKQPVSALLRPDTQEIVFQTFAKLNRGDAFMAKSLEKRESGYGLVKESEIEIL